MIHQVAHGLPGFQVFLSAPGTIPVWYIRSAVQAGFFFSEMTLQIPVLLKLMNLSELHHAA
jgi:hypothetical protein